jgi:ribonuclease E
LTSTQEGAEQTGEERRGRRRRRRRGQGDREASANDAVPTVQESIESEADVLAVPTIPEPVVAGEPDASVPTPAAAPTATPAPLLPPAVASPIVLPRVQPAPMVIETLASELDQAGLILVQTAAEKHAEAQARIAAEPAPVPVSRERTPLPPLDAGPLIQVETRGGARAA